MNAAETQTQLASQTEKNTQVEITSVGKFGKESSLELGSRGSETTKYVQATSKIVVNKRLHS